MTQLIVDADVSAIIDTDVTLAPFVAAAVALTDDLLASAGHADALTKEIQRWVAAHLVSQRDPRVQSESFVEGLKMQYEGPKLGMYLAGSRYGQQAMLLDSSGILSGAGKRRASFSVH